MPIKFSFYQSKIIERGKHEDLLANKGAYYRIYEDQLGQAD